MSSITADGKSWENKDFSFVLYDELGKPLNKKVFEGTICEIGGFLYIKKEEQFYDIVLEKDDISLVIHDISTFPLLER